MYYNLSFVEMQSTNIKYENVKYALDRSEVIFLVLLNARRMLMFKIPIYRVVQKYCDILYFAYMSTYVNDITLFFFQKMRREKLYKTFIKKILLGCPNGFL